MKFKIDDLTDSAVLELLADHINHMSINSPPESRHVLDVSDLKKADITFWSLWNKQNLLGCVALKQLSEDAGEIKSMKVAPNYIRQGVGNKLLDYLTQVAQERGYQRLYLETGSMNYFKPARKLYENNGFKYCEPFANYIKDDNNVFMVKTISS